MDAKEISWLEYKHNVLNPAMREYTKVHPPAKIVYRKIQETDNNHANT